MAVPRVLIGSSLVLALTACGGGDDEPAARPADTTTSVETTGLTSDTTAPTTTAPAPTTTAAAGATTAPPVATDPATTAAPTTVPAPEPVAFDLASLPTLVEQLADLTALDPLEYAMALGFPIEVGVPDGSTLYRVDATVDARETDAGPINEVDTAYSVIAPGGTIPDVDIELDDNGPGSVQVTEVWDPIMTALGYERTNSTASDPGDPGGPNSVNHVYVPTPAAATDVNGVPADIGTVFVWADEDLTGASYDSSNPPLQGGYRIDLSADVGPDAVPVPILAAIIDAMPVPDGATLTDAALRIQPRSPDSFDADKGPNYLDVTIEWAAPAGMGPDDLAAFYTDEASFDGEALIAAEVPLSGEGPYRLAEVAAYGDTDYRLALLLVQRYGGWLSLAAPYEAGDPAEISYHVTLNPTDTELAPPS